MVLLQAACLEVVTSTLIMAIKFYFLIMHIAITHYLTAKVLQTALVRVPPTLLILNSRCRPLMELIRLLILTGFVHYQD